MICPHSSILFIIHEFLSLFVTLTQTIIVNNKKKAIIFKLNYCKFGPNLDNFFKGKNWNFPLPLLYEKTYHPHWVQVGKECPLGMGGGGLFKCEIMKLKQEGDKM